MAYNKYQLVLANNFTFCFLFCFPSPYLFLNYV